MYQPARFWDRSEGLYNPMSSAGQTCWDTCKIFMFVTKFFHTIVLWERMNKQNNWNVNTNPSNFVYVCLCFRSPASRSPTHRCLVSFSPSPLNEWELPHANDRMHFVGCLLLLTYRPETIVFCNCVLVFFVLNRWPHYGYPMCQTWAHTQKKKHINKYSVRKS